MALPDVFLQMACIPFTHVIHDLMVTMFRYKATSGS
jgi:hypothetical protein